MPLRALINNEEKVSISFNDIDWNQIKERQKNGEVNIILPCCKQKGFLRTSSKGLKHFIHAKGQNICDWKPETPEHLMAKAEVIKACLENGWQAIPEFADTNWRADVLAIKNEAKIAFEIQWSSQTTDETESRQIRYNDSQVRGCWFFRTIPKQYREYGDDYVAIKEIPFFKIKKEDDGIFVLFNSSKIELRNFVSILLKKQIKFCDNYRAKQSQEVEILIFDTHCWKCHSPQQLYTVPKRIKSCCNTDMYLMGELWGDEDFDKHTSVYSAVKDIIKENPQFKIGELKPRYSKTVGGSYKSFGCFHCDAIFGDFPLRQEKLEVQNSESGISFLKTLDLGEIKDSGKHWCHSPERKFCC